MTESTLFGISLATKGGGKPPPITPITNKQAEKNGSQAGGWGGGRKLRKFRVPIDEQNCDGMQPKKGASAM